MWEQQHELGTQKMYSLAPSLTICFTFSSKLACFFWTGSYIGTSMLSTILPSFSFVGSSLEGRRQHMWMVHAIGRTRPSKVANSTHSSFTYKELQERLDCEQ